MISAMPNIMIKILFWTQTTLIRAQIYQLPRFAFQNNSIDIVQSKLQTKLSPIIGPIYLNLLNFDHFQNASKWAITWINNTAAIERKQSNETLLLNTNVFLDETKTNTGSLKYFRTHEIWYWNIQANET